MQDLIQTTVWTFIAGIFNVIAIIALILIGFMLLIFLVDWIYEKLTGKTLWTIQSTFQKILEVGGEWIFWIYMISSALYIILE